MVESVEYKEADLIARLKQYPDLVVAFSGGVDSTYLLAVAVESLAEKVIALSAQAPIHSRREKASAIETASRLRVSHFFVETRPLELPEFVANSPERCYHCKKHLFSLLWEKARALGFTMLAHGANLDDADDYRPGAAAASELNVRSPLVEAGMTKADIRRLSRKRGLPTWDKPAMACLATRIAYGEPITPELLQMIEAAEDFLFDLGLRGCRVRRHGPIARIEVPQEFISELLRPHMRLAVLDGFKKLGFTFVTVDLQGYVQGSMNRMTAESET